MVEQAQTLTQPTVPDSVSTIRIETYRGGSCWKAIWQFLNSKKTGSFEVHVTQGFVAVVQFKMNERNGKN